MLVSLLSGFLSQGKELIKMIKWFKRLFCFHIFVFCRETRLKLLANGNAEMSITKNCHICKKCGYEYV